MVEENREETKKDHQAIDHITYLPDAPASCFEALVQMRCIIVPGTLTTAHAVNHHNGNVEVRNTQHHQGKRDLGTTYNRKHRQSETQELRAAIAHNNFCWIPVMRQETNYRTSKDNRKDGDCML